MTSKQVHRYYLLLKIYQPIDLVTCTDVLDCTIVTVVFKLKQCDPALLVRYYLVGTSSFAHRLFNNSWMNEQFSVCESFFIQRSNSLSPFFFCKLNDVQAGLIDICCFVCFFHLVFTLFTSILPPLSSCFFFLYIFSRFTVKFSLGYKVYSSFHSHTKCSLYTKYHP